MKCSVTVPNSSATAPTTTTAKAISAMRLKRSSRGIAHSGLRWRIHMPMASGMIVIANTRATMPAIPMSSPIPASKCEIARLR